MKTARPQRGRGARQPAQTLSAGYHGCTMKLYTKRGDDGGTDLFGGQRVTKDDLRVEAYGTVDELNAVIGQCAAACEGEAAAPLKPALVTLMSRLFEVGADLATPVKEEGDAAGAIPRIGAEQTQEVERLIDATCAPLPAMKHFVLPGGTELAARLHLARTVCRRAERRCVALSLHEDIGPVVVPYLNRVSDLLFALARRANQLAGVEDTPWVGPRGE